MNESGWWRELWEERGRAVSAIMGETDPPGQVVPFSWEHAALPGACALVFPPHDSRDPFTYMTLGMTQPVTRGDPTAKYEFAIQAKEHTAWPLQILYDLLTYWLKERRMVDRGLFLPLLFFRARDGALCAGLTSNSDGLDVVGWIRRFYLWNDMRRREFHVSNGDFRLMTATAVTADEYAWAKATTPPHLLLLLKRMGVGQVSDHARCSVLATAGAFAEAQRVQLLSHDQAVDALAS